MASTQFDFTGETVVITGGSSGIGRAMALRLGRAGATVINADVDPAPKDIGAETPTHELLKNEGETATFVETDVADIGAIESVLTAATEEFGGLDIMINNAAIVQRGGLASIDEAAFDRIFNINVKGVFFGTKGAVETFRRQDTDGVVLNTASISSSYAQHDQVVYDATKGAIRMITRSSALETANEGIRINAVAPGQIATEIDQGWTETARENAESGLLKPVPMERAGEPAEIAGPAAFLCTEDASYVTGEMFFVDGGWQIC